MYVKLFEGILKSSVWAEPDHVLRVWLVLLLQSDEEGYFKGVESAIATLARVTPAKCRDALTVLESPDLESQSPEYGGARIQKVQAGWFVINKKKYRDYRTKRQMQAAERQSRKRLKDKGLPTEAADAARDMSVTSRSVTPIASASASVSEEVGGPGEEDGAGPYLPDVVPIDAVLSPLAAIVAHPDHLHAVTILRREHKRPAEFDRALEELLVAGWTGATLGAALVDLLRTNARFSQDTLLAFAKRIAARGPRTITPPSSPAIVPNAPVQPKAPWCLHCGDGVLEAPPGKQRLQQMHAVGCPLREAA